MSETQIVEFGAGKVGVMRTAEIGESFDSGLAFVHQEAHPIGKVVPGRIGKTTDDVGCFLRFHFSNPQSVQVVIDDLIVVRDSIKAAQQNMHWTAGIMRRFKQFPVVKFILSRWYSLASRQ